jgi:hypothetical protein
MRATWPLGLGGGDSYVYTDSTTDFRPTNQAADAMNYNISPGYLKPRAPGCWREETWP